MLFIFFGIAVVTIIIGLVIATKVDGGLDGVGGVIAGLGNLDSYKLWIFMGGIYESDGNIQNSK